MAKEIDKLILEALKDVLISEKKDSKDDVCDHNTQFHYGTLRLELEDAINKIKICIPFVDPIMSAFESIHNGDCEGFVFMEQFRKALSGRQLGKEVIEAAFKALEKFINKKDYKKDYGFHKDIDEIVKDTKEADTKGPGKDEANIGPEKLRPTPKVKELELGEGKSVKKNLIIEDDPHDIANFAGGLDPSFASIGTDSERLEKALKDKRAYRELIRNIDTKLLSIHGASEEAIKLAKRKREIEDSIKHLDKIISSGGKYSQDDAISDVSKPKSKPAAEPAAEPAQSDEEEQPEKWEEVRGVCKICHELKKNNKDIDDKGKVLDQSGVMWCPPYSSHRISEKQANRSKSLTLEDIAQPCEKHNRAILGWEPAKGFPKPGKLPGEGQVDVAKDWDYENKMWKIPVRPICSACHYLTFGSMEVVDGKVSWKSRKDGKRVDPLIAKYNKGFEAGYLAFKSENEKGESGGILGPGPAGYQSSEGGEKGRVPDRKHERVTGVTDVDAYGDEKTFTPIELGEAAASYNKLGHDGPIQAIKDSNAPLSLQYTVIDDDTTKSNLINAANDRLNSIRTTMKKLSDFSKKIKSAIELSSVKYEEIRDELIDAFHDAKESPEYERLDSLVKDAKLSHENELKIQTKDLIAKMKVLKPIRAAVKNDVENARLRAKELGMPTFKLPKEWYEINRKVKDIVDSLRSVLKLPSIVELKSKVNAVEKSRDGFLYGNADVKRLNEIMAGIEKEVELNRSKRKKVVISKFGLNNLRKKLADFIKNKGSITICGDKIERLVDNDDKSKILCKCDKCGTSKMISSYAFDLESDKLEVNPNMGYGISAESGYVPYQSGNPGSRPTVSDAKVPIVKKRRLVKCAKAVGDHIKGVRSERCGGELKPIVGCGATWFSGETSCPVCGKAGISKDSSDLDDDGRFTYKCNLGHIFQDAHTNEGDTPELIPTGGTQLDKKVEANYRVKKASVRDDSGEWSDTYQVIDDEGLVVSEFDDKNKAVKEAMKLKELGKTIKGGSPIHVKPETHRCKTCGMAGIMTPYERVFSAYLDYDQPLFNNSSFGRMVLKHGRVEGSKLKRQKGKWSIDDTTTHFYVCPNYLDIGRRLEFLSEVWYTRKNAKDDESVKKNDQILVAIDQLLQLQRMHRWNANGVLAVDTAKSVFDDFPGLDKSESGANLVYSPCKNWHPRGTNCRRCKFFEVPVIKEKSTYDAVYSNTDAGAYKYDPERDVVATSAAKSAWAGKASDELTNMAELYFTDDDNVDNFNRIAGAMLHGDPNWSVKMNDLIDNSRNITSKLKEHIMLKLNKIEKRIKDSQYGGKERDIPKKSPGVAFDRRTMRAVVKKAGRYRYNHNGIDYNLFVVPISSVNKYAKDSDYDADDDVCECDHLGSEHGDTTGKTNDKSCRACPCGSFKSRVDAQFSKYMNAGDIKYEIAIPVDSMEAGTEIIKNYMATIHGTVPNSPEVEKVYNYYFKPESNIDVESETKALPEEVQRLLRDVEDLGKLFSKVVTDNGFNVKNVIKGYADKFETIKSNISGIVTVSRDRRVPYDDEIKNSIISKIKDSMVDLNPKHRAKVGGIFKKYAGAGMGVIDGSFIPFLSAERKAQFEAELEAELLDQRTIGIDNEDYVMLKLVKQLSELPNRREGTNKFKDEDFNGIIIDLTNLKNSIEASVFKFGKQWAKNELLKNIIAELNDYVSRITDKSEKEHFSDLVKKNANNYEKLVEIRDVLDDNRDPNHPKEYNFDIDPLGNDDNVGKILSSNPLLELVETYKDHTTIDKAKLQSDTDAVVSRHSSGLNKFKDELVKLGKKGVKGFDYAKKHKEFLHAKNSFQKDVMNELALLKDKYEVDILYDMIVEYISHIGNDRLKNKFKAALEAAIVTDIHYAVGGKKEVKKASDADIVRKLKEVWLEIQEYQPDLAKSDTIKDDAKVMQNEAIKLIGTYFVPNEQQDKYDELDAVKDVRELANFLYGLYNDDVVAHSPKPAPPTMSNTINNLIRKYK